MATKIENENKATVTDKKHITQKKRVLRKPKFLEPQEENIDGFAVLSAFLGLSSITCCGCSYITCIPAIVTGIFSLYRKKENNTIAIIGIILGIVSIYLAIFCLVYSIIAGSFTTIVGTFAFVNYFDKSLI